MALALAHQAPGVPLVPPASAEQWRSVAASSLTNLAAHFAVASQALSVMPAPERENPALGTTVTVVEQAQARLEALVRDRVETLYHPACSARMAPRAEGGVVDARLRVYGVAGLRVCDASVYTEIVSGHTAGACFALGEKLAEEILVEVAAERGAKA